MSVLAIVTNRKNDYNVWLFQAILMIQNPEPYLMQSKGSDSAIVMKNATLAWTRTDSLSSTDSEMKGHKQDETSQEEKTEAVATLRNISFTLPKVCFTADMNKWG